MEITNNSKRTLAAFGWGALFIWWGISFIFDPITIGFLRQAAVSFSSG